jgi:hypothetical protein
MVASFLIWSSVTIAVNNHILRSFYSHGLRTSTLPFRRILRKFILSRKEFAALRGAFFDPQQFSYPGA